MFAELKFTNEKGEKKRVTINVARIDTIDESEGGRVDIWVGNTPVFNLEGTYDEVLQIVKASAVRGVYEITNGAMNLHEQDEEQTV